MAWMVFPRPMSSASSRRPLFAMAKLKADTVRTEHGALPRASVNPPSSCRVKPHGCSVWATGSQETCSAEREARGQTGGVIIIKERLQTGTTRNVVEGEGEALEDN